MSLQAKPEFVSINLPNALLRLLKKKKSPLCQTEFLPLIFKLEKDCESYS